MKHKTRFEVFDGVEVPVSPLLKRQHINNYGSIADLDNEDLIEPSEIERLYLKNEFAPILALPVKTRKGWVKPYVDEDGTIDLGAFGTVDFDKYTKFDKALYKIDKLREELFHERLMVELISSQIKTTVKYKVINYVLADILDVDDILDIDIHGLARRCLRMRRLQREIDELTERNRKMTQQKARKFLELLD